MTPHALYTQLVRGGLSSKQANKLVNAMCRHGLIDLHYTALFLAKQEISNRTIIEALLLLRRYAYTRSIGKAELSQFVANVRDYGSEAALMELREQIIV